MDLQASFQATQVASRTLGLLAPEKVNALLLDLAATAVAQTPFLLRENEKDLARMAPDDPRYDRLQLTAARLESIAQDIESVAALPSPLGKVLLKQELPNGLQISKVRVPLGVVGIIYEARPNVTFDVVALCLKTGNACLLKGGSDASFSNEAIISVIHEVLCRHDLLPYCATLLPPTAKPPKPCFLPLATWTY
ncbi:hypothetical protein [Hymenobacter volaticus]|uniref:hypothetical protein n=1 Tax=Hymenobacter volaticus TaxID=2932254 RepID=UPI003F8D5F64